MAAINAVGRKIREKEGKRKEGQKRRERRGRGRREGEEKG